MSNITDKAKEYLRAGLSVVLIPGVNSRGLDPKKPIHYWNELQDKALTEEELDILVKKGTIRPEIEHEIKPKDKPPYIAKGIKLWGEPTGVGIITGTISGGLEVIDVDTKHDDTGTLWDEFRTLIKDNLPDVYSRLVISQTQSGGYHIYYRYSSVPGNLKLSIKLNKEVLIETRGEGGYVVAPPTPGYTYIQGEPGEIPTLTTEERSILLSIARSFNQLPEDKPKIKASSTTSSSTGLSPWEDYNSRGDVIALLESKGWTVVSQRGERVNLLRPGDTDSKTSGNFHTGLRTLRVFSSSTEFNPDKAYSPSQVFSLLECKEDSKLTYRRLLELGYGEPYKGETNTPTQVKTERIKVEVVNSVNRESSVISTPGDSLKIENLQTAIGEEVVIYSPGGEATEEVLKAIAIIQETGKRIYIREGDIELRDYSYQLRSILIKYGALQEGKGTLTEREIHSLLDEVVITSQTLQPLEKDLFKKLFLSQGAIKPLGITEESLSITVDKITSTRDKESQAKEFKKLLSEATQLQDKGETDKALKLLDERVKEVKLQDKATEFSSLLIPIKEAGLKERLAKKPESLNSGYTIDGEDILLPSGAISVFSAPTSHGKTTFLINLALNVTQTYPDKEMYFFSYEEDGDAMLMNALNSYIGEDISRDNRKTIRSYFTTGSTQYVTGGKEAKFTATKDKFFRELVDTRRLNIIYSSYNSDTLIEAIRYLSKHSNPGAIFIDYIQLLNLPEGKYKTYSRQEEIKQICIALKDVAVETGLPLILGAQFNREVVNQLKLHPTKIGEAGDIERIANLIVGFWNNNFKPIANDGELKEINERGIYTPDTLYTTILKNRGGRVGLEGLLSWQGNSAKVKNSSGQSKYSSDPF